MSDDLDLTVGDPSAAEPETPSRRRRRRSSTSDSSERRSATTSDDSTFDTDLKRVFAQTVEWRERRDDDELAEAIREGADAMTDSIVILTSRFTPMRKPLVIFVGILVPLFSFSKVGAILGRRFVERRQRKMQEQEAAMAEWEAQNNGGGGEVPVTPYEA